MITNQATTPLNQTKLPGRLTLLLIMATVSLPMICAYWIFYSGIGLPSQTINKGVLITPAKPLTNLIGTDKLGSSYALDLQDKWSLITVTPGDCDIECRQFLFNSHQVHVRLAKEAHRIQRLLLLITDTPNWNQLPVSALSDSGLTIVAVTPDQWQQAFSGSTFNKANTKNLIVVAATE